MIYIYLERDFIYDEFDILYPTCHKESDVR